MNLPNIKLAQVHKQEFENLRPSKLILNLTGNLSVQTVTNTLRRLSLDHVPTYAFPREYITIERNTSIFDNDKMRLRLCQLTLPKIKVNIDHLEDKYWRGLNISDPTREKHPADKTLLEIYISATNETNDILNVTTNHSKVYQDGQELKNKFDPKFPLLIVQLKPGEQFSCRMVGVLGIGKQSDIWAAAANSYFDLEEDNSCKLTIESQGQLDEYQILTKSCTAIIERLKNIKSITNDHYSTENLKTITDLQLVLQNEDHTTGYIINEFIQNNNDVIFSGLSKPDLLTDSMVIKFKTIKKDPLLVFIESVDGVIQLFINLQNQILKLGKNFIN